MSHRSMKIVFGYKAGIDALPHRFHALGLTRRVAFVLSTYRPDEVDLYFDVELYAALVEAVRDVFGADRMTAKASTVEAMDRSDASGVKHLVDRAGEDMPLDEVILHRGDTVMAAIGSEPWANVGGPEPYNDSYAIPIYSREDRTAALEEAARATCRKLGGEISEVIRMDEAPSPPGVLSRLKSWLAP